MFRILVLTLTLISLAGATPNIIYILADDLGYGDLGCYGQKTIKTPHLDQLAKNGIRFTNHHSGSTVCAPSRACLMTGLHTGHVSVRGNGNFQLPPDPKEPIIARILKKAGYHTAMIGKSGTGCNVQPGHPNQKGFDHFFGFNGHKAAHRYYPPLVFRNAEEVHYPGNKGKTGDTYIHDVFLKEIHTYLDQRAKAKQPFFLHYAALIPHADVTAPEKWVSQYRGKVGKETPSKGGHYVACPTPKATTAAMISRLDWEVGEIIKQLNDLGLTENTLIMFSSDNGPHSVGGRKPKDFDSSGPYKGHKRDLYEGGVRVPFIASWPGKIAPGTTSDHLSAFWDILPTFCELTKQPLPENIDGLSLLPTLLGKSHEQKKHRYLYWEFYEKGGRRAALTQEWKAVQLNLSKKKPGSIEIYNIKNDPGEEKNLAKKHPKVVKQFEDIFAEAHSPSSDFKWGKKKK